MAPGEISPTCKVKNAPPMDDSTAATLQAPDMKASAETFLANWFPAAMLQLSLIHI